MKKRAALALLRLIRKTPPEHNVVAADTFSLVINSLLDEQDLGLLLSSTTLLQGICARNGPGVHASNVCTRTAFVQGCMRVHAHVIMCA